MKRIWFTQQKPFNYTPLRMGLGYIRARAIFNADGNGVTYVPKLYTTRAHPLSGEYVVVEGSRFKATPVMSEIRFAVYQTYELDLKTGTLVEHIYGADMSVSHLSQDGFFFPELDLGYFGATFDDLRNELLKLNKKATIDTPFYVNKLEPIEGEA